MRKTLQTIDTTNKASGLDGGAAVLLKQSRLELVPVLTKLFDYFIVVNFSNKGSKI